MKAKRYCVIMLVLAILPTFLMLGAMSIFRDHAKRARAHNASNISEIERSYHEVNTGGALHFALIAFLTVSLFRQRPESPSGLWIGVAAGYALIGLILLHLAVPLLKPTPGAFMDPGPIMFLIPVGTVALWIVPAVILALKIARLKEPEP